MSHYVPFLIQEKVTDETNHLSFFFQVYSIKENIQLL